MNFLERCKLIFIGAGIGLIISAFLIYYFGLKEKVIYRYIEKPIGKITGEGTIKPNDNPQSHTCDFIADIPIKGNLKTEHVEVEFTGTTKVERKDNIVKLDTVYNHNVKVTLTVEKEKHWDFYAGIKNDNAIIGLQYNYPAVIKNFSVSLGAEFETQTRKGEFRLLGHYKF